MEFIGKIKQIGSLKTYTTEKGYHMYRLNIVVEETSAYPDSAVFTLRGDDAKNFKGQIDQNISVLYNMRTFTTKDGKVCNTLPVFSLKMWFDQKNDKKPQDWSKIWRKLQDWSKINRKSK